jgi:Ca2+-binding RTX toxin-like protein
MAISGLTSLTALVNGFFPEDLEELLENFDDLEPIIDFTEGNNIDRLYIENPTDTENTIINYTTLSNGTITGGSDDGFTFQNAKSAFIVTGSGNDNVNISATVEDSDVFTGAGNDTIVGGSGNDEIRSGAGNDVITSGAGKDVINAGTGNDRINTGSGDDRIQTGTGADTVDGGSGNDFLNIDNGLNTANTVINYTTLLNGTITGGSNNGTTFKNIESVDFSTGSGNDRINVSATISSNIFVLPGYNNLIDSGAGNDTIIGGSGNDAIDSRAGNDSVTSGAGNDRINSGAGNDVINAGAGNDRINTDAGNDRIETGTGADTVDGGSGNDLLYIDNGLNTANTVINYTTLLNGTITGGSNNGTIFRNIELVDFSTGSGNDRINVSATTGSNLLNSGAGNDTIVGGSGIDNINSGLGNDSVTSGAGNDIVNAGAGNDTVNAGAGDDSINAQEGNDTVNGDAGKDRIDGGAGNDTLNGGAGNDTLIGGTGRDTFVFGGNPLLSLLNAIGTDTITDLTLVGADVDKIQLSKAYFTALSGAPGSLAAADFRTVTTDAAAATSIGEIVYNSANGKLFYNADGNDIGFGTNGGQFAQLNPLNIGLGLTEGNFTIGA